MKYPFLQIFRVRVWCMQRPWTTNTFHNDLFKLSNKTFSSSSSFNTFRVSICFQKVLGAYSQYFILMIPKKAFPLENPLLPSSTANQLYQSSEMIILGGKTFVQTFSGTFVPFVAFCFTVMTIKPFQWGISLWNSLVCFFLFGFRLRTYMSLKRCFLYALHEPQLVWIPQFQTQFNEIQSQSHTSTVHSFEPVQSLTYNWRILSNSP